jgi:hypothetical protein
MGRDIRIEEVNGGYIIRAYEPPKDKNSADIMYDSSAQQKNEIVVANADEAKGCIEKWLKNEAPPFKKEEAK